MAIIPPQPLKNEVEEIKRQTGKKYHSFHALKSPPHITLIPPFRMNESTEHDVMALLKKYCLEIPIFNVELDGFGSFKPHVIFLKPIPSQALTKLFETLAEQFYESFPFSKPPKRPFHPHMTVAFRDLSPKMYYQAWEYFERESFKTTFLADRITLLKHNGKNWEEFNEFLFKKSVSP